MNTRILDKVDALCKAQRAEQEAKRRQEAEIQARLERLRDQVRKS